MTTPMPSAADTASAGPPGRVTGSTPGPLTELPISELLKLAKEQFTHLAQVEVRRVQADVAVKGRHLGIGAGLFGGAAMFAFFGAATLIATLVLLLALVLPAWAAALVVAVVLFAVAAVLALVGRGQLRKGTPLVPREAIDGVKADLAALAERVHR